MNSENIHIYNIGTMYLHKISGINFNNIKSWWYWLNGRYMLMKIIVKQHLIGSLKLSSELNSMGLRLMSFWTHRTDWPLTIFLQKFLKRWDTINMSTVKESVGQWGYIWWVLGHTGTTGSVAPGHFSTRNFLKRWDTMNSSHRVRG